MNSYEHSDSCNNWATAPLRSIEIWQRCCGEIIGRHHSTAKPTHFSLIWVYWKFDVTTNGAEMLPYDSVNLQVPELHNDLSQAHGTSQTFSCDEPWWYNGCASIPFAAPRTPFIRNRFMFGVKIDSDPYEQRQKHEWVLGFSMSLHILKPDRPCKKKNTVRIKHTFGQSKFSS